MIERRQRRSEEKPLALRYYLDHFIQQRGSLAAYIADQDGLLLAHSASDIDTETLAAFTPICVQRPEMKWHLDQLTERQVLHIWPIHIARTTHYLASVGGLAQRPPQAETDINRILA